MQKKKKVLKNRHLLIDPQCWLYDFVKITGALGVLIYFRLKVYYTSGKKPKGFYRGKYLGFSNHISMLDPIIMLNAFWRRRLFIVCTEELFKMKFWGPFFRNIGCIGIDKQNPSVATFKDIKEKYRRGHVVGIFPEGKISDNSETSEYKSGVAMIAILNDCPIIPMYIVPRKSFWHRQVIIMGDKINCRDYLKGPLPTMEEIKQITDLLHQKETELMQYAEMKMNKKGDKNE